MKPPQTIPVAAILVSALALFFLSGCATARPVQATQEPGVYETYGWNTAAVWWNNSQVGEAGSQDINGEVGHPLYVRGPSTVTVPSNEASSSNKRIASGTLPPGMTLDAVGAVTGIPTERGHWIVTLEVYGRSFRGVSYKGYTQQLRFHITGSGRVNN